MDETSVVATEIEALIQIALDEGAVESDLANARRLQQWYEDNRALADAAIKARYQATLGRLSSRSEELDRALPRHPFYRLMINPDPADPIRLGHHEILLRRQEYLKLKSERSDIVAELARAESVWEKLSMVRTRIDTESAKQKRQYEARKIDSMRRLQASSCLDDFGLIKGQWMAESELISDQEARSITASVLIQTIHELLAGASLTAFRTLSGKWALCDQNKIEVAGELGRLRPAIVILKAAPQHGCEPWTNYHNSSDDGLKDLLILRRELRRYIDWQAAVRDYWASRLRDAWKRVLELADVSFAVPHMSRDDYRLCGLWAGAPKSSTALNVSKALFARAGGYEAARLLSARAAEHIARSFYEQYASSVRDVSITQLIEQEQGWKAFDLEVDGRPIDVKNARSSFSSPNSYVEHTVPAFKLARSREADQCREVAVVGVLSEYLTAEAAEAGAASKAVVLGEVRQSDLLSLVRWTDAEFDGRIQLDRLLDDRFLPGWVFEYPRDIYPNREAELPALCVLDSKARKNGFAGSPECANPGLVSIVSTEHSVEGIEWSKQETALIAEIRSLKATIGVSRRSLFAYSLGRLLSAIDMSQEAQCAAGLRRIFYSTEDTAQVRPLGLLDTCRYIGTLIDLLAKAGPDVRGSLHGVKYYRLTHPQILRGFDRGDRPVTIYAYCGGRRRLQDGRTVSCGRSPIIIGMASVCASNACGHLVCPDCGYCSRVCPDCAARQADWHGGDGGLHRT